MTRKRRRMYIVFSGMLTLGAATALILTAFSDNIVLFCSPTDIQNKATCAKADIRLGGLVEEESLDRGADGVTVSFRVTDLSNSIPVTYKGILPDLFREGQGVVTEGTINAQGVFVAREVLAKHDENYMPKEVSDALKATGNWHEDAQTKDADAY
ncbi:cytochrome c maturation protein CcmE [Denitrobaculum tricleocarpae]|uniref:Cytochrome c-type biogenesis protein CcmE n=1 Tax=Denitrobaculum tricleocarpae TaxID=2591009 RepID=A0A545TR12_9PROT|nr:cytochrome c maturation protein CcmE [Denitrobaculum tricleocarpae]TQV79660.1 cytochrome c maturation protein CcmE [Denitrobaculum tricleocarpae]